MRRSPDPHADGNGHRDRGPDRHADGDGHRDRGPDRHGHRYRRGDVGPNPLPSPLDREPGTARLLAVLAAFATLPPTTKRVRGKLTVRFKKPPAGYAVKSVTVKVNAKKVATLKGTKLNRPFYLRRLSEAELHGRGVRRAHQRQGPDGAAPVRPRVSSCATLHRARRRRWARFDFR